MEAKTAAVQNCLADSWTLATLKSQSVPGNLRNAPDDLSEVEATAKVGHQAAHSNRRHEMKKNWRPSNRSYGRIGRFRPLLPPLR